MDHYVGLHSIVPDDVHAYGVTEEKGFGWRNEMQIELKKVLFFWLVHLRWVLLQKKKTKNL